jgi:hypothetical protein
VRGSLTVAVDEVPLAFQPVTHQSLAADRASHDPPRIRKAEYLESVLKRDGSLPADHPYVIQAIALGDLLLIALSSEPVVDWSLKLKSQFAGLVKLVWIAGYCNDMFCYLPTRRVQAEGGYEGGRATLWGWVPGPFTDDVEDRVSRALTSTVKHVLSDEE